MLNFRSKELGGGLGQAGKEKKRKEANKTDN